MQQTLVTLLLSSAMFIAAYAHSEAPEPVDQIIITGARAPLSVSDVGSAVTVLDSDHIERRQARYVTDLLRSVPGFAVSRSGVAGSQTQVRVRGSEANHVLVLIDGIRANDPAAGDEFRWEYLTTANIERIEIVRGPQSSLWGSDAVAAVVHVITKSGERAPGIGAYLETGSENTLNGSLRGGYSDDRWSVSGAFERLSTDGSNVSRVGDEKDDSEISTASLTAGFRANGSVSFNLGARYVDAYSQFDTVDFATGLPADSDVATDVQQTYLQAGSVIAPAGKRFTHRLNARYFDSDNRNLVAGVQDSSALSNRVNVSYQSDIAFSANLLSLAIEHERTTFEQRGQAAPWGDPNQDQALDVTSAVADFQGRNGEGITWLLSARFDDNSDFDDSVTGRVSFSWELADGFLLRANVGTAQKNPTFIERFGFFPGQFVGNEGLRPERSTSYDLGFESRLRDDAVRLQVTLFEQDLEDEINGFTFDPASGLFTAENVSGTSARRGAELAARWQPIAPFELGVTYTYTDSTEGGVTELRRPRHAGSLHADYRFLDERARLSLAADYGGTSSDIYFPPWPSPAELVTLANYWLVDISAQYELTPAFRLFARASNLLDSEYEQVYGYRTLGRSVYAGIQLNF